MTELTDVLIIGAGPGGICAAIELQRAGESNFVILEKADGVGGTWWHNRYPGAECDVQSHLYSFSFQPKLDWTRPYAGQAEILAYVEEVADRFGVTPLCRFNHEVASLEWRHEHGRWRATLHNGRVFEARVVISAIGMFNDIALPDIDGLEDFAGTQFHTARWPREVDLAGKRVALIGSAASAVQTAPEIAPVVAQLDLYQRTPQWVVPKRDEPFTPEALARFRSEPRVAEALREDIRRELERAILFDDEGLNARSQAAALQNIQLVEDEDLRTRLTPDWSYGCRRPLLSNKYYPMFNRSNVRLVDEGIERIVADGVVLCGGELRPADVMILATGFETTRFLSALDVTGRAGLHIRDAWTDGAQAYMGITAAGFPNLFMLYGPNTNNNSLITMLELEVRYSVRRIRRLLATPGAWMDVTPAAMAAYNVQMQRDIDGIAVWGSDCRGYYRAASGRNVTQFPYTMTTFERMLDVEDDGHYEFGTA